MNRETRIHLGLCRYVALKYGKALFHSDTGSGVRLTRNQARILSRMRRKRGHPDWTLYEPRGGAVGLHIELKAEETVLWKKDETLRKVPHLQEQYDYMIDLTNRGWVCYFAVGLDEAIEIVDSYMKGKAYAPIRFINNQEEINHGYPKRFAFGC